MGSDGTTRRCLGCVELPMVVFTVDNGCEAFGGSIGSSFGKDFPVAWSSEQRCHSQGWIPLSSMPHGNRVRLFGVDYASHLPRHGRHCNWMFMFNTLSHNGRAG